MRTVDNNEPNSEDEPMATFNMTREMAEEYHRATDGGAHPPDPVKLTWQESRPFARITAVTSVTQSCALCAIPIDISHCTPDTYGPTMAAHHAVCPKRPIEPPDEVRWEYGVGPKQNPENWSEGEVLTINTSCVKLRVRRSGAGFEYRNDQDISLGLAGSVLRRIPRPEAQARSLAMQAASRIKAVEEMVKERYSEPPAPVLVDGLTLEQCVLRWSENRLAVEGGAAPPNVMTRMQVDVARALWMQRFGAQRSAALRERVAADREAERNRVRVDVQDLD